MPEIEGMTIFYHDYLYSAYVDDTTFFLKDIISVKYVVDLFYFFVLSKIKPNLTKSEIVSIGVLKGVKVVVCGMLCVDLNNDTLKLLGTQFSYIRLLISL